MALTITSTVRLNNGVLMPRFGLGVFKSVPGNETYEAVGGALEAGYRHIDTAKVYGNEADVGRAIAESGIPRDQIFVTTKLWNSEHAYDKAIRACDESLARLGMTYVDLYLIHWPVKGTRLDAWRALVELQGRGKCRAIGVSNYMVHHMDELLGATDVVPAVNQVEFSPFLYRKDLLDLCSAKGVVLEAYSPLTRGQRLTDPTLAALAATYGKSPAQLIIRWILQRQVVVIPKSVRPERIAENAAVFDFELSESDMATIDSLDEHYTSMPRGWIADEWE